MDRPDRRDPHRDVVILMRLVSYDWDYFEGLAEASWFWTSEYPVRPGTFITIAHQGGKVTIGLVLHVDPTQTHPLDDAVTVMWTA